MNRREVADAFARLAFAHEMVGDPFKARSWANASRSLFGLQGDLEELHRLGKLALVRGLGASALAAIEAVGGGGLPDGLIELEAQIPPGLFDLRQLPGLGPKKVKALWTELGVSTIGELEYACQENRLVGLAGFGEKTQQKLILALKAREEASGWFRRDQVLGLGEPLRSSLAAFGKAEWGGGFRRGESLLTGAVLVSTVPVAMAVGVMVAAGADDAQIDDTPFGQVARGTVAGMPLTLHMVRAEQFGWAWIGSTGDDAHLALLKSSAAWGVGAAPDEREAYRLLGFSTPDPERRDATEPLAVGHTGPKLVVRGDLRGAIHVHTTASDGRHSLVQMRDAAIRHGLSWLGVTDHSETAFYAGGLDAQALARQSREIEALNAGSDFKLLAGVESDILQDGRLDYGDEVLGRLQVVVASVHRRHKMDRATATARMLRAARDPFTHILGHPTGRLLLARPPVEFDVDAVLDACAECDTAVELNASPHRLDFDADVLSAAKERGVKVSIGPDAHSMEAMANLDFGVAVARRAGLTAGDVINSLDVQALSQWLGRKRSGFDSRPT